MSSPSVRLLSPDPTRGEHTIAQVAGELHCDDLDLRVCRSRQLLAKQPFPAHLVLQQPLVTLVVPQVAEHRRGGTVHNCCRFPPGRLARGGGGVLEEEGEGEGEGEGKGKGEGGEDQTRICWSAWFGQRCLVARDRSSARVCECVVWLTLRPRPQRSENTPPARRRFP